MAAGIGFVSLRIRWLKALHCARAKSRREAAYLDYRTGATAPSYARAVSFMMTGIQQHLATQRRSMAVSHSRDELTSARIRHISAQKNQADRKTEELEPRDRFDTSWANGVDFLDIAE